MWTVDVDCDFFWQPAEATAGYREEGGRDGGLELGNGIVRVDSDPRNAPGQSFSPFFFGCPVRMGQMGQNLRRARPRQSEGQVVGGRADTTTPTPATAMSTTYYENLPRY